MEAHLQMNNNNKINLHTFPIQFSRMQLRWQITLKGFHVVCHHVGQMYPPVEASSDQEQYYVKTVRCKVTLTFTVRYTFTLGYHLCLNFQMYPAHLSSDIPPVEASGGQEWYYIRSS